MSAKQRLVKKLDNIVDTHYPDQDAIDDAVNDSFDANEILTVGLMPLNSKTRSYVVGCLIRSTKRKQKLEALKATVKEDDLVPVEVQGGGKCKITVFMTKEAVARERS